MDFDGDGRLDILAGSRSVGSAGFYLFQRNANGSWAPRRRLEMKSTGKIRVPFFLQESFVTAADWNGDRVPDLLCVAAEGQGILVALGPLKENEPITFSREIDFTPRPVEPGDGFVWDFAVADWDRDGKPDLLIRQKLPGPGAKEGIYWYRNLGGAGLPKLAEGKLLVGEKSLVGENSSDVRVSGFCVCDWNADGWPDLIVTRDELSPAAPDGKQRQLRGTVWLYLRE